VTLGLRNGLSIAASVDKVQGEQVRLRYPKPIAVDRQVAEQARGRTGPESVRVAVSGHVAVEADGRKIIALLRDISLFGIQIADASAALQPGAQVTIHIAGLTQRLATVRWQADGYAGLRFAHSIGYELLDNWLIMQGGADHQSLPRFRNAADIR
jgi:hypothetical protein